MGKKKKATSYTGRWVEKVKSYIGPGLVTGASDDDPSGIATYAQAGAAYGFSLLWTSWVAFPLMAAVQQMCARIGLVTSRGLAGTLKKHYPPLVLWLMLICSTPAIIMNIGANIAGMGAVGNLLFPSIDADWFSVFFTMLLLAMIIYLPYRRIASVLQYLCIVMLVYLIVPFFTRLDFSAILQATCIPQLRFEKEFLMILVAVFGTTISPYLFFWQAIVEVEENNQRKHHIIVNRKKIHAAEQDVDVGMGFSGLIMFFIILTAGAVLYPSGLRHIDTVEQAASALKPLAGSAAYFLFSLGVIATGLISIPVLSGSLSYLWAESFGWKQGLDKQFHEARAFYITIAVALLLGLSLNYVGISPMQGLIYTAILYGITAPVLIAIILHIANNEKIMGKFVNTRLMNVLGVAAFVIMTIAAVGLLWLSV